MKIIHSELPALIVFSIDEDTYRLEYDTASRKPYTLTHVGVGYINTSNINEWLALRTRAVYSLDFLRDLAAAFEDGRSNAYSIDDMVECARLAFIETRKLIYRHVDSLIPGNVRSSSSIDTSILTCVEQCVRKKYTKHDESSFPDKRRWVPR